jgi:hypothetical protein
MVDIVKAIISLREEINFCLHFLHLQTDLDEIQHSVSECKVVKHLCVSQKADQRTLYISGGIIENCIYARTTKTIRILRVNNTLARTI